MADVEPTIPLEELGKAETVKVYTQAYVDRQEKRIKELETQIEKMKECTNCPVWLLNQTEKNCKDCEYKEALILLRR